ncbi:Short-chain dehydrogenase TIC 32 A, chloroplastic, partial [Cucurbita argyrosperma subsp. sororia]
MEMTFATNLSSQINGNPRPNSECDVQYPQPVFRRRIRMSRSDKPEQQVRLIFLCLRINGGLIAILILTRSREYDATRAYTVQLAHRLQEMEANVTVNCVHPGVVKTKLNRDREGFVIGAATSCKVAANRSVDNVNGKYFADCND